jgi:hypothetical protein
MTTLPVMESFPITGSFFNQRKPYIKLGERISSAVRYPHDLTNAISFVEEEEAYSS